MHGVRGVQGKGAGEEVWGKGHLGHGTVEHRVRAAQGRAAGKGHSESGGSCCGFDTNQGWRKKSRLLLLPGTVGAACPQQRQSTNGCKSKGEGTRHKRGTSGMRDKEALGGMGSTGQVLRGGGKGHGACCLPTGYCFSCYYVSYGSSGRDEI